MSMTARQMFGLTDDRQWLDILIRSVNEPVINGVEMPRFPHGSIQRNVVGAADEVTLREAFSFYTRVKALAANCGKPLTSQSRFLDFGVGWGRYARMFWNDVPWENISGVDVDGSIVSLCQMLGVPGYHSRIDPRGRLPYEDATFDHIIAYSVFSHLPEPIAEHWMAELSRVAKPGAVFAYTTEPRRFLDFVESIPDNAPSEWHKGLARQKHLVAELRQQFDEGKLAFLPTSGGEHLDAAVYGDTCIPQAFIAERWSRYFTLREYLDDANHFWQAFVVVQKS